MYTFTNYIDSVIIISLLAAVLPKLRRSPFYYCLCFVLVLNLVSGVVGGTYMVLHAFPVHTTLEIVGAVSLCLLGALITAVSIFGMASSTTDAFHD